MKIEWFGIWHALEMTIICPNCHSFPLYLCVSHESAKLVKFSVESKANTRVYKYRLKPRQNKSQKHTQMNAMVAFNAENGYCLPSFQL